MKLTDLSTVWRLLRPTLRATFRNAAPASTEAQNRPRRSASTATAEPFERPRRPVDSRYALAVLATSGAIGLGYYYKKTFGNRSLIPAYESDAIRTGELTAEAAYPVYTRDDVALHTTPETGIWVTYLDGVYDITDFVRVHQGGADKIMLAAGAGLEPFWDLYAVHKESKEVEEILQRLKIGVLDASEMEEIESDNPYDTDPIRDPELIVLSKTPFNAETPYHKIATKFETPSNLFYVRNHLPVPEIDDDTYSIAVSCPDLEKDAQLSLHDLKTKFTPTNITATITCAGNRRDGINSVKMTKGLKWKLGAISNATFTGARLRDVLMSIGVTDENMHEFKHVCFEGHDQDPTGAYYGASIPIEKAMARDGDVLLAYEMNGEELSRDHGYPLRAVVPGVIGARNVKWLQKIEVTRHESQSHWQQNDYKLFCPSTDWDTVDFSKAHAIQNGNVQSAICTPLEGDFVSGDHVKVSGYAWSGGGNGIVRVDVSVDGGQFWHQAELQQADQDIRHMWAWTLWTIDIPVKNRGQVEIICKATDSSYNAQPDNAAGIWNLRRCLNNSWHRVKVNVK